MDKQINHDKHHDESKTRTHRLSKLPDDGDPWVHVLLVKILSTIYWIDLSLKMNVKLCFYNHRPCLFAFFSDTDFYIFVLLCEWHRTFCG